MELHGRYPVDEVRGRRIGALVGSSRAGKSHTKRAIEAMHPEGVRWIPKRCLPRQRSDEKQGHVLQMDQKNLLASLDKDHLVTSIVDLRVPNEIREYLKQYYCFSPPSLEQLQNSIIQYMALFLIEDIESNVLDATDDQIVMVELSVWDIEKWKETLPMTEIFWLDAPPQVIVDRARKTYPNGLRTVYNRARLAEALLSCIYPPTETLVRLGSRRLWSVTEKDRQENAECIWETLRS